MVAEQFVQSKTGQLEDCEDALFTNDYFIAVIDGATSKTTRTWNGKTGGQAAGELIRQVLSEMPPVFTARHAADAMTSKVSNFYTQCNLLEVVTQDPCQRITASLAVINLYRQEVWLIGDCQCLMGNRLLFHPKKVDEVLALVRALVLELEILKGATTEQLCHNDCGRAFITPLLEAQTLFQNNLAAGDYWYPAIDGFTIPDEGIIIHPIPDEVTTIVLASDGYPVLQETREESERMLQEILLRDPLLRGAYKSTKGRMKGNIAHDDRAFIKVRLVRKRPISPHP
jgi:glycerophosphoryl diester phosphodiesterase